jgi:Cdc6-like AAA superfamily ATPase
MWLQRKGGILYCPGMPGAGKTHIASLAIYYLQSSKPFHSTPGLAYIYCEYTHQLTRDTLLGSLLEQLARVLHPLPNQLITLHENHKSNRTQPSVNELQKVLQEIASSSERCFIIVDGLDECANDEGMRSFFLETLAELQQSSDANILIMSRDIQHIENYFQAENRLQIEIKAPDDDIRKYLDHRIPRVLPFLASNPALCRNMKAAIMEAAGGMYVIVRVSSSSISG